MTRLFSLLILLIILHIPAGLSFFYYSLEASWPLFFRASLFLLCAIGFAFSLASLVSNRLLRWLIVSVISTSAFAFEIFELTSYYLQGESFNERFFFHLTADTARICWDVYPELTLIGVLIFVAVQVITARLTKQQFTKYSRKALAVVAAILLITLPLLESSAKRFATALKERSGMDTIVPADVMQQLQSSGLNIRAINPPPLHARPGKNLVLLYLESMETLYTEEEIFAGLTPNINRLATTGLHFANIRQIPGASWSMGSMATSQCGTPLLVDGGHNGNDLMHNGYLSQARCLGDILAQAGYQQTYLVGAAIDFAGMGAFYKTHQFQEALGLQQLQQFNPEPKYRNQWGLYDETLYDIAYKKFEALAASNKPFNLTLITTDTHHPHGHFSRSCARYPQSENSILQAVHCADQLVQRFLDRIAKHPAYKDTIVVLYSDHLSMRNVAEPLYPKDYDRKLFFLVLNATETAKRETAATPVDVAPTLLDLMQVKHNAEFLAGQSLIADQPKRLIDLNDKTTIRLLRWVNTDFFTNHEAQLCPKDSSDIAISYQSASFIKIGKRQVALAFQGHASSTEEKIQRGELALVAFFNKQRQLSDTIIVPAKKLEKYIAQHSNEESLIILSKSALAADHAPTDWETLSHPIRVIYNRRNSERVVLASFAQLKDLAVTKSHIPSCSQ